MNLEEEVTKDRIVREWCNLLIDALILFFKLTSKLVGVLRIRASINNNNILETTTTEILQVYLEFETLELINFKIHWTLKCLRILWWEKDDMVDWLIDWLIDAWLIDWWIFMLYLSVDISIPNHIIRSFTAGNSKVSNCWSYKEAGRCSTVKHKFHQQLAIC